MMPLTRISTSAAAAKICMTLYLVLQFLKHGPCTVQAQRAAIDDACAFVAFGLGACLCSAAHHTQIEPARARREVNLWDHLIWF
mmetsp:Transcript_55870/g.130786  ORF Transcript_55870/g.130786 Transcript_55870/m.130786 type:complete len:84 (-) Transcript_55870:138-389(-)